MMFVMALLIVCMCVFVFGYPKFHANQIIAAFFGVFYVAVMLSCIYETRSLEGGKYLVWLIFLLFLGLRYLCILRGYVVRENIRWHLC